jgi:hypothetical protein
MSESGLVSRASPVHTAVRNCTRDEGGPFEVGNHGLISSRCKLLRLPAEVMAFIAADQQMWRPILEQIAANP